MHTKKYIYTINIDIETAIYLEYDIVHKYPSRDLPLLLNIARLKVPIYRLRCRPSPTKTGALLIHSRHHWNTYSDKGPWSWYMGTVETSFISVSQ